MSTIGYYICVPFAWLVRLFYNLTGSYGVALILFTLVIKLIMLPFQTALLALLFAALAPALRRAGLIPRQTAGKIRW